MSAVPSLTIVTLAPATMAPDESVTVPRMVPLTDCASAAGAAVATINAAHCKKAAVPNCRRASYVLLRDEPTVDWRPHDLKQQRTLPRSIGARFRGRDKVERLLPIQADISFVRTP